MATRNLLAVIAFTCGAFTLVAQGPSDLESRLTRFDESLEVLRRAYAIPGLSVAVLKDQRIAWEKGYGFQDLERRVRATPDTPYRVASLTKTFTSVLLLQCVERGTLNLDEPIRRYSPGVAEAAATVRQVLSHTSERTPGQEFRYNGDRYAELTPVVEACSGDTFRRALATQILDRAGMRDSVPGQDLDNPGPQLRASFEPAVLERYATVLGRLAKPYQRSSFTMAAAAYPPKVMNAAAGLVSTVRDLASYDAAIDRDLLLRRSSQELAWTAVRLTSGQAAPYGLGWFVQRHGNERVVWHFGLWPGSFSSLLLKVPDRNLTLILLANSDGLSLAFSLGDGDIERSPFASLFFRLFLP